MKWKCARQRGQNLLSKSLVEVIIAADRPYAFAIETTHRREVGRRAKLNATRVGAGTVPATGLVSSRLKSPLRDSERTSAQCRQRL
jgi:hypothetical protein